MAGIASKARVYGLFVEAISTFASIVSSVCLPMVRSITSTAGSANRANQAANHTRCAGAAVIIVSIHAFTEFTGGVDFLMQAGVASKTLVC